MLLPRSAAPDDADQFRSQGSPPDVYDKEVALDRGAEGAAGSPRTRSGASAGRLAEGSDEAWSRVPSHARKPSFGGEFRLDTWTTRTAATPTPGAGHRIVIGAAASVWSPAAASFRLTASSTCRMHCR